MHYLLPMCPLGASTIAGIDKACLTDNLEVAWAGQEK